MGEAVSARESSTSYSRPRPRHDNPYTEALFRTGKSCPAYPAQGFARPEEARAWRQPLVQGDHPEHRHNGIGFVTPVQRPQGQAPAILAHRQAVYEQARERPPERGSGSIRHGPPLTEVWLNRRGDRHTGSRLTDRMKAGDNYLECAGRPARSRWCKSITMKE